MGAKMYHLKSSFGYQLFDKMMTHLYVVHPWNMNFNVIEIVDWLSQWIIVDSFWWHFISSKNILQSKEHLKSQTWHQTKRHSIYDEQQYPKQF